MEKAIEIKRRAQRCVQNGDVDGALREYEKLVETPESDPYNFVLLADLLFKKGEQARAGERYLNAVTAYEKAGLYKNAIAVCKKMMRLSLSQTQVLRHLAELHALDGLASEASIYFAQYAEHQLRANHAEEAIVALQKAFDNGQENVKLLERLSEVLLLEGEIAKAAAAMHEAAKHWETRGQGADARRCHARANVIHPESAHAQPEAPSAGPPRLVTPSASGPADDAPADAVRSAQVSREPEPVLGVITGSRIPAPVPSTPPTLAAPPVLATPPAPPTLATPPALAVPPRSESGVFERAPQFVSPVTRAPEPKAVEDAADEAADGAAEELVVPAAGVYDIGAGEDTSYESALREANTSEATAPRPTPFAEPSVPVDPSPSTIANRPADLLVGVTNVESLLQRAQAEFRAGNRDRASQALVEAALAYERLDRLDSAATIFRSLGRGAQAPIGVMELWLANCEKRSDAPEGSQVACELGDRALNDGHESDARRWFERALAIEPGNDTARRRLQRMTSAAASAAPTAPAGATPTEVGRVAVAVGRGQAVTFDLNSLLQEFQRGVESQLDGDTQGHYDLGMAYREMGLHDEAVGAFRIAERDSRLAVRAQEMCGRSLADSGQHEDAVQAFERALRFHALDAAGEAELRYQMALSLAATGEMADAVAQMEIADMRYPGRSDVLEKLVEWRRAFGQAA